MGRKHFERAIEIAAGQYLMTKVIFAEQYAKLTFDKDLYDQLLTEVLAANPVVEGITLTNVLAQQRAQVLLAESDDYF
ncbi:TRAP transporter TatT component family protein [Pseudomonadales bacterium]|nr:TRAP transporter TatT component family protein [Pseudomonadales bacterium]